MNRSLAATLVIVAAFAGCLSSPSPSPSPTLDAVGPGHVLVDVVEPTGLTAPTFKVSTFVPDINGGEPSLWAAVNGDLVATFPGCEASKTCNSGPVYRSSDNGTTWKRLNFNANGSLSGAHRPANGDADAAVDANGTIFAANLGGGGIQVDRLARDASKWQYAGNVVPEGGWADRQWIAAGQKDQVAVTWMGGGSSGDRQVAVTASTTGGRNWTEVQYLGEGIGWLGPAAYEPNGTTLYVPFTQPAHGPVPAPANLVSDNTFELLVVKGTNNGAAWEVLNTGVTVVASVTGVQWSGTLMAPAFDVLGDGTLAYVWSEETSPGGTAQAGAIVRYVTSKDQGKTWSAPFTVSNRLTSIMPWAVGGAGDRLAITYYASDVPSDSDYAGQWDVVVDVIDGVGLPNPQVVRSVIEPKVHFGGICSRGGVCGITASDRSFLDFFESDVTSTGQLVVIYAKDLPNTQSTGVTRNHIELKFALQEGGSPLFVKAP